MPDEKVPIRNKYNIVVIGGGIGGLVSGAILARNGFSVAILEKNDRVGGTISNFVDGDCLFDLFGTYIYGGGFAEPLNFLRQVLDILNIKIDLIPIDPPMTIYTPDKNITLYRDRKEFLRELFEYYPSYRRELNEFYEELNELYEILLEIPQYRPMGRFTVLKTAVLHPHLSEKLLFNSFNTLNKIYKKYGFSDEIRSIIDNIIAHYTLLRPYEIPAFLAAYLLIGIHREGLYYTKGSNSILVDEIARVAREAGAEIITGAEVKEILISNNYARGVILKSDRVIHADRIISNTTAYNTFTRLINRRYLSDNIRHRFDVIEDADSFFYIYLKAEKEILKGLRSPNVLFIPRLASDFMESGIIRVFVPSMIDSSLTRDGSSHNLIVSTPQQAAKWSGKSHRESKARSFIERLLNSLENILPGIKEGSEVLRYYTPLDIELITGREDGTFGKKMDFRQGLYNRGGNKTVIENLYLAGDSTFPGQGISMAAYSGKLCAELIIKERGKKLPI